MKRFVERAGFGALVGGVLVMGFLRGQLAMTIQIEFAFVALAFVLVEAVMSSLIFSGFMVLSGAFFVGKRVLAGRCTAVAPTGGAHVTAIVPVYRDANVLHRSVESLVESTYEDLDVLVVCEPDDRASQRRANELADEYDAVSVLVNTERPGSKAGAINYAVEQTDGDHVAVFDADEAVDPEFIASAAGRLEDCDVVQGRTVPEPTGLVESFAYYESVLLSYVGRRLLYVFTGFRMAASRAVVLRRSALQSVGGYDEGMLTEDFDFAYRCYKGRLDVEEELAHPSRIEAAHTVVDWWGQRKRWMTGYVQVFRNLFADIWGSRDYRDLTAVAICAGTVSGSLLMLSLVSKFAVLFVVDAGALFLAPLGAVLGTALAIRVMDYRADIVDTVGWRWLLVPLVFPLYSLAALKSLVEYLFSWDGEWYRVAKGD